MLGATATEDAYPGHYGDIEWAWMGSQFGLDMASPGSHRPHRPRNGSSSISVQHNLTSIESYHTEIKATEETSQLKQYQHTIHRHEQIALSIPSCLSCASFTVSHAARPWTQTHSGAAMVPQTNGRDSASQPEEEIDLESEGTNLIRRYLSDPQDHERLAVDLSHNHPPEPFGSPKLSSTSLGSSISLDIDGSTPGFPLISWPIAADEYQGELDAEAVMKTVRSLAAKIKAQRGLAEGRVRSGARRKQRNESSPRKGGVVKGGIATKARE